MRLKVYERTGIKEERVLKDKKLKLIEQKQFEQAMRCSIQRGIYKKNCKDCYDLRLMDRRKEYKKTEDLLEIYQDMGTIFEENIWGLIEGYVEYFNTYGSRMSALGLRGFRKNIERVIQLSREVEKEKRKEVQIDNAVLEFVIDCYEEIECADGEIDDSDIMYLMYELGIKRRYQQEEVKIKIKRMYEELKDN